MSEVTYLNHDEVITQRPWRTVTRWLIVANVLVFVLDYFVIRRPLTLLIQGQPAFTEPLLAFYGHFSVFFAIFHYQFWRFFTYQFVHANIEHILLNMMGLFMAGPLVEAAMGRVRFTRPSSTTTFCSSGARADSPWPTTEAPRARITLRRCNIRNGHRRRIHPPWGAGSGTARSIT